MIIKIVKGSVKRKQRKPTVKALKVKADKLFSDYIRQRGAVNGINTCITCGAEKPWQSLQAGHFYRRVHLATRWEPDNTWPQCPACNILRRGNYANFAKVLYDGLLTKKQLNRLHTLSQQKVKLTVPYLQEVVGRVQLLLQSIANTPLKK